MQLGLNFTEPSKVEKVIEIQQRLCHLYGCPIRYFSHRDPLSELVSALLSHRTKNAASRRAFQQLQAKFASWEAVRDGDINIIEQAVAPCTWADQKARRLQQVFRHLTERCGGLLTLDFLAEMSVLEARTWLETIPGVGPKTSAAVLAFSTLRRRALPVDSHHHRVAVRLGLISKSLSVGAAHPVLEAQLPEDWNAQQVYDNHEVLMLHGQQVCHYHQPKCQQCCLTDLCRFFQDSSGCL